MELLRCILAFFLLTISQLSFADDDLIANRYNDCGIKNGEVISFDGSLCQEDIAYGFVSDIFPSIIDEISPLIRLMDHKGSSNTVAEQALSQGNFYGDETIIFLFDLFYYLSLGLFIAYFVLVGINLLGDLIRGDLNNKNDIEEKDSIKSYSIGAVIAALLLIPYKNIFLGMAFTLIFGLGALSLVNAVYSTFLALNEADTQNPALTVFDTSLQSKNGIIDRHTYLSDSFYRYLLKMELCRKETSSYWLSGILQSTANAQHIDELSRCSLGLEEPFQFTDYLRYGSGSAFVWGKQSETTTPIEKNKAVRYLSEIEFKVSSAASRSCTVDAANTLEYKCGSFKVYQPNWGANPLVTLLGQDKFINFLADLHGGLKPNMSAEAVKSLIRSVWVRIDADIRDRLSNLSTESTNIEGVTTTAIDSESEDVKQAYANFIATKNKSNYQTLAADIHQYANNILMFGAAMNIRNQNDTVGQWMPSPTNSLENLKYHEQKVKSLADIAQRIQCNDQGYKNDGSYITEQYLKNNRTYLPTNAHARCLDVQNKTTLEYDENANGKTVEQLRVSAVKRDEELAKLYSVEWGSLVNSFAETRRGVESSYVETVQSFDGGSWWHRLRLEGYLSIASYIYVINQNVEQMEGGLRRVINSFESGTPNYDSRYVSVESNMENEISARYPDYIRSDQVINSTNLRGRIDPYIDNQYWLASQEQMMRQPMLYEGGMNDFYRIFEFMTTPTAHLSRLGFSSATQKKDITKCLNDASFCPFPTTDPSVELSQFGKDIMMTGFSFYSTVLAIQGVALTAKSAKLNKLKKQSSKNDLENALGSISNKKKGYGTSSLNGLISAGEGIFTMTDFLFDVFGIVILFAIVLGAALYYILPILPIIYLYLNFIAWLLIYLMSAFSVMLGAFLWLRYRSKRELISGALTQYGVELLFRPLTGFITVLFAYLFFRVVAFFIAITIGWFDFLPVNQDESFQVMDIILPVIYWLVITFLYGVGLALCYRLMSDMYAVLLDRLGVQNKESKDKVTELVKMILFDAAVSKGQSISTGLKQKKAQLEKDMKEHGDA
jgi:hypothetical protein